MLQWTEKKREEEEADRAARPAVTPEPEQDPEPRVKETTTPDPDRKITQEEVMALMRASRQRVGGDLIVGTPRDAGASIEAETAVEVDLEIDERAVMPIA